MRVEVKPVAHDSRQRAVSPNVGAPRLVAEIIKTEASASFQGHPLSATPVPVSNNAAPMLLAPDRKLPVVVVTQAESGKTLVEPERLARTLAGLANVMEVPRDEMNRMNGILGPNLSCFDGGVRTYFAGLTLSDHRIEHPVCSPPTLRQLSSVFHHIVLSQLLERSTRLHEDSPIWLQASEKRVQHIISTLSKSVEDETLSTFQRDLEEKDEKIRQKETELAELQGEIEALNDTITSKTSTIKALRHNLAEKRSRENEEDLGSEPKEFWDVLEAVEQADDSFGTIRIWDSAKDSAKDSPFKYPEKVYETLEWVEFLGQELRSGGNDLGGLDYARWFKQNGLDVDYRARESKKTMAQYGKEREFRHPVTGEQTLVEPHIAVGSSGRDPTICLRIHLYWDSSEQMWEVGHVGKHLRVDST